MRGTQESEFSINSVRLGSEYWFKTVLRPCWAKVALKIFALKLYPFMGTLFTNSDSCFMSRFL